MLALAYKVPAPSGGCEKIEIADFVGVLFLKGNLYLRLNNRL
jgi:hypothetical protein